MISLGNALSIMNPMTWGQHALIGDKLFGWDPYKSNLVGFGIGAGVGAGVGLGGAGGANAGTGAAGQTPLWGAPATPYGGTASATLGQQAGAAAGSLQQLNRLGAMLSMFSPPQVTPVRLSTGGQVQSNKQGGKYGPRR